MRVRLNLATKAQETHRRFLVGAGAVAGVAGIVFLILGWHVYSVRKVDEELRARTQKMQEEMAQLERQRSDLERFFNLPENAKLHDRAAFLNSIIDARSFNWTQMFMDLEHILPGGVHVVSIEPRQVKGHVEVKLTIGADSDEAKLKFLRALEESKVFTEVALDKESVPIGGPGGDQKVVQLSAVYSRI
jgi:type IV pilus assembly protein PilN